MTAIAATGRRITKGSGGEFLGPQRIQLAVTATKFVKPGGLAMLVAAGTCEPGAAGTGNVCLGICDDGADNTNSLSPAPIALIRTGNFSFLQTGTTITASHIGTTVYMADDQTVTLTATGNSPAGTCIGLDDDGTSPIVAVSPLLPIVANGFALQSRSIKLTPASFVAGQGTGADTNGTVRRYNLGAVLPAGATLVRHLIRRVTATNAVTSLSAAIGVLTPVDDFDVLVTANDMQGVAGYYQGTAGDGLDVTGNTDAIQAVYGGAQLTVSVTPDAGEKVSAVTVGEWHATVWFLDGTGI